MTDKERIAFLEKALEQATRGQFYEGPTMYRFNAERWPEDFGPVSDVPELYQYLKEKDSVKGRLDTTSVDKAGPNPPEIQ